ncbi:MAG: hypothetical protein PVI97_19865 [Candidatus Thiodiazotropha sp.]
MNERDVFYSWEQACDYVGDSRFLNEVDECYFHFSGFASVEVESGTFERVYVDGYLKLYSTDVNELKKNLPVSYSSTIIDHNITINGVVRNDLFQKFLVFDEELLIGEGKGALENEFNYPQDILFNYTDLECVCDSYGIRRTNSEPQTQPLVVEEQIALKVIGALACMVAMNNDLDSSLQDEQYMSDIIIDDLFTVLDGMGIEIDGKQKFLYERLISEGVKSILDS